MSDTKATITWEQFLAAGVEGQKCEWVDGEIVQMTPVDLPHEATVSRLIASLDEYSRAHPEWICFASNAAFTMSSGNWRCPDASLVRKQRFAGGQIPLMAEFTPDVAFEVHSPSDKPSELQSKRKDYQQSGVIQVWIDPEKRFIELVYPDRPLEYLQEGELLTIAGVAGFALEVKSLFTF
jgi:Uma2 family endonuclease